MSPRGRASKQKIKLPDKYKDTDCELLKNKRTDTRIEGAEIEETMGNKAGNLIDDSMRSEEVNDSTNTEDVDCLDSNVSGTMGHKGCLDAVEFPTVNESVRKKAESVSNTASKQGNGSIGEKLID